MAVVHPLIMSCFGLFLLPVTRGLHITRGAFSISTSIIAIACMLCSPIQGRLLRQNYHRVLAVNVIGAALAFASFGLAAKPIHLYISAALAGAFFSGSAILPVSILLTGHYREKSGLATSIALAGSGAGGCLLSPFVSMLCASVGWNATFWLMGGLILVIGILVLWMLRNETPEGDDQQRPAEVPESQASAPAQKTGIWNVTFIAFLAGIILMAFVVFAVLTQLPAIFAEGFGEIAGPTVYSACMLLVMPAKILLGLWYDKKGTVVPTIAVMASNALLVLVLALFASRPALICAALLYAFGTCAGTVPPPVLTRSFCRKEDYAKTFGIVNAFCMLGSTIGPPIVAGIYDLKGTYAPAWILCVFFSVISTVLLLAGSRKSRKTF